MQQLGLEVTSSFVLFDVDGQERWRGVGTLYAEAVRRWVVERR